MKKFLLALGVVGFASILSAAQFKIPAKTQNDTETDAQINADIEQYQKFGDKYDLFETCGRTAVGAPWFARLYDLNGDPKKKHWEVENYPSLAAAIKEVEKDYLAHPEGTPEGYVGTYKK